MSSKGILTVLKVDRLARQYGSIRTSTLVTFEGERDARNRYLTVHGILDRYRHAYFQQYRNDPLQETTPVNENMLLQIGLCGSGRMGSHRYRCQGCHGDRYTYNTCNQRHCPRCCGKHKSQWLNKMLLFQLPCDYIHAVFTLPHEWNRLIIDNKQAMLTLLLRSVTNTLAKAARKASGGKMGMTLVLHTWGQKMNQHVHVHVLLTAGALSQPKDDQPAWHPMTIDHPALDCTRLAADFKKRFLRGVSILESKKVPVQNSPPMEHESNIQKARQKDWVVHLQMAPRSEAGPEAIIRYLSRYAGGSAITDGRLVSDDGRYIVFDYKDYSAGKHEQLKISGVQFVRRYLIHVLPAQFNRVRNSGLFAAKGREERLHLARRLINEQQSPNQSTNKLNPTSDNDSSTPTKITTTDPQSVPNTRPANNGTYRRKYCTRCGLDSMEYVQSYTGKETIDRIRYQREAFMRVVATLSAIFTTLDIVLAASLWRLQCNPTGQGDLWQSYRTWLASTQSINILATASYSKDLLGKNKQVTSSTTEYCIGVFHECPLDDP